MKFNLRTQLTIWLLLLTLVPLCSTIFLTYQFSKNILFEQTKRDLELSILKQANLLDHYINVRTSQGEKIIDDLTAPSVIDALKTILQSPRPAPGQLVSATEQFHSTLAKQLQVLNYSYLFLVTPNGEIRDEIAASGTGIKNDYLKTLSTYLHHMNASEFGNYFKSAKAADQITIESIYLEEFPTDYFALTTLPLTVGNETIGYGIAVFDAFLFYQVLAESNEIVLDHGIPSSTVMTVTKIGKDLYIMTPKHLAEDKVGLKLIVEEEADFRAFVQKVIQQPGTFIDIINFRNKETMMISRHFKSSLNWAIVNIVTIEQILAPIQNLKKLFWILAALTSGSIILLASFLARRISQPILALTDKTRLLADGDLSQHIEIKREDEIGMLGQSFNDMAFKLHSLVTHLDSLVEQRTKQYEEKNTELERAIHKLEQIQDRLIFQEKLASLGQLTAGIAHEIKNPLNFINNFAELTSQIQGELAEECVKIHDCIPKEQQEKITELLDTLKLDIDKIYEHGKRADSIVKNMLQHSRAAPGHIEKVNLNPLIDEYITLAYHGMRAQYQGFNVQIEKNFDPNLPKVSAVPQEISRVIINLLNNAYYALYQKKLSSPSTYSPTLTITTAAQEEHVVIKIRDNGIGMTQEVQSHLFTPFFTTKPSGEGTGLGLSLSYNVIVQGHHGTLTVNSEPGQYAEFVITLPID
jgi:two-component system, NtrC family, sensor kinase